MTAEPQPLTPDAIQSADASLNAYLEARAADFNAHGWSDDGVIETRDGHSLMAHHIDITLRRARAAETARDQERAANTLMRRTLEKILRNFYEKGHPGEPCLRSGWVPVREIEEARELLTALSAETPADAPVATPTPPAQSNSGSPPQPPPVTAWDQFCGATIQPGDATSRMTPLTVRPKPCSRRPAHTGPHGNSDGTWWTAPPEPEYLPGYPGKLARPPADIEYAKQPIQPITTPESVATYKLDHCGPCRDAMFYGWSGHMADRAHAQHLTVIEVGPLAGNPCCCAPCANGHLEATTEPTTDTDPNGATS